MEVVSMNVLFCSLFLFDYNLQFLMKSDLSLLSHDEMSLLPFYIDQLELISLQFSMDNNSLNEENMPILYEEPCDKLSVVNILFFICKSFYNVKDIDVTKHVVAMVVTASKTGKSYVIDQFHFQHSSFTFL